MHALEKCQKYLRTLMTYQIDENTNNYGTSLIEFLQESRICILNGQGNEIQNNYTSMSINRQH